MNKLPRWNKYTVAELLALHELDSNEAKRIPAAKQRELFGYVPFGKQLVQFNPLNQGTVEIRRSTAYGSDQAWTQLSYAELAAKLEAQDVVRA